MSCLTLVDASRRISAFLGTSDAIGGPLDSGRRISTNDGDCFDGHTGHAALSCLRCCDHFSLLYPLLSGIIQ